MVTTIEYSDRNVVDKAWKALDQRLAVDIIVRGWRVALVRRAMPLCPVFFGCGRPSARHTAGEILRMGLYGWWSAALLGIYNHALLVGMTAAWRETTGAIVVSFRSSTNA